MQDDVRPSTNRPETRAIEYSLPRERIAQEPAPRREDARLLRLDRRTGARTHHRFADLPSLLRPGDLVVLNDTKVVPSRLAGLRPRGRAVRALLVLKLGPRLWECLIDSRRPVKPGEVLAFAGGVRGRVVGKRDSGRWEIGFDADLETKLDEIGSVPLPPYIKRPQGPMPQDRDRYQTVYARTPGSIAAPTAGLHFTAEILADLEARGMERAALTLDIGVGTFAPIRTDAHKMEPETYRVGSGTLAALQAARSSGRRIVAVGTSVVRVVESLARGAPPQGSTDLFIFEPFEFRATGALLTNFHLPRGTPLALVSAFAGRSLVLEVYAEAIRLGYRFYSYGDAMLIE